MRYKSPASYPQGFHATLERASRSMYKLRVDHTDVPEFWLAATISIAEDRSLHIAPRSLTGRLPYDFEEAEACALQRGCDVSDLPRFECKIED